MEEINQFFGLNIELDPSRLEKNKAYFSVLGI